MNYRPLGDLLLIAGPLVLEPKEGIANPPFAAKSYSEDEPTRAGELALGPYA